MVTFYDIAHFLHSFEICPEVLVRNICTSKQTRSYLALYIKEEIDDTRKC